MALSKQVKVRIRKNQDRRYWQWKLKTKDPQVIADFIRREYETCFKESIVPTVAAGDGS